MAEGVENASIVCCFMSPEYQDSKNCKLELQYAQTQGKRIIPCIVSDKKGWKPSDWLGLITAGLLYINFKGDDSEENIQLKAKELCDRIKEQPSASTPPSEPTYLMELLKYEYIQNSCVNRVMNPEKSFPIEQSYINLAIVKAKEQHQKEKQLRDAQHGDAIMSSFEEIYGMKTAIDIKDIFETCKNQKKQVLVFGRAGIGKSTFCRYVAYKWATGSYWPQYELLAFIPLRRLTTNRYPLLPPGQSYSLIDLVKTEVFPYDLSEKDKILLKKHYDTKKILWILDGYDEIVQNVPHHLEGLFEQLLKTPHHILTSRPYLNTLSYNVQMEITGFIDQNIIKYVEQFFDQMKDELDDASIQSEKLLSFLQSNASIWGVAHIPINLELICSLWSNTSWPETEKLTITTLYSMMTEWLCRRYLTAQNIPIQKIPKTEVSQRCQKELVFLESLAFKAMESNTIIIRPTLLEQVLNETKVSLQDYPHILNIGILKSFNKQGTGTQIETDKDHYFVHLSFQEYFAARYLINVLKEYATQKAIEFIKYQKYNQRYALVFPFAAGLLSQTYQTPSSNVFWDNILGEPLDLVGIRHMQLIISCIEETTEKSAVPQRTVLFEWIAECIKSSLSMENHIICNHLSQSLQRNQSIVCDPTIINVFINLLQCSDTDIKSRVLSFISELKITKPSAALILSVTTRLDDRNKKVRQRACKALESMAEKVETSEVTSKLVDALRDADGYVQSCATDALRKIAAKAATNEIIRTLVSALDDKDQYVRYHAYFALETIGEKAVTNDLINKLVSVLCDPWAHSQREACIALENVGEKAATNEVFSKLISRLEHGSETGGFYACEALVCIGRKTTKNEIISMLVSALENENSYVRQNACKALGNIGEKAATNEVISKLASALHDENENVREQACKALVNIGKKWVTNEVISMLVSTLENENSYVRQNACRALGNIGERAATNEVISKLANALGDENRDVRAEACKALGSIGETAATSEVISKLANALGDENMNVRGQACRALESIGEKVATNEVISKLASALGDEDADVRQKACTALGNIGKRATENEVISMLVSALENENSYVRQNACEALGNIGEKAATNEVISKLANAVGDENEGVRWQACKALRNMTEKAATDKVISKLVSALGDDNSTVRQYACGILVRIDEKAATKEVISELVSALGDIGDVGEYAFMVLAQIDQKESTNKVISELANALEGWGDRLRKGRTCRILESMGEKAATEEVINKLAVLIRDDYGLELEGTAADALANILNSSTVLTQLNPKTVLDLCFWGSGIEYFRNVSGDELINFVLSAKRTDWICVVTQFTLLKGAAVIATKDKIVVYGRKEPVDLPFLNIQACQQLIETFTDQAKRLQLYFEMPVEAQKKLPTSSRLCNIL